MVGCRSRMEWVPQPARMALSARAPSQAELELVPPSRAGAVDDQNTQLRELNTMSVVASLMSVRGTTLTPVPAPAARPPVQRSAPI